MCLSACFECAADLAVTADYEGPGPVDPSRAARFVETVGNAAPLLLAEYWRLSKHLAHERIKHGTLSNFHYPCILLNRRIKSCPVLSPTGQEHE